MKENKKYHDSVTHVLICFTGTFIWVLSSLAVSALFLVYINTLVLPPITCLKLVTSAICWIIGVAFAMATLFVAIMFVTHLVDIKFEESWSMKCKKYKK